MFIALLDVPSNNFDCDYCVNYMVHLLHIFFVFFYDYLRARNIMSYAYQWFATPALSGHFTATVSWWRPYYVTYFLHNADEMYNAAEVYVVLPWAQDKGLGHHDL